MRSKAPLAPWHVSSAHKARPVARSRCRPGSVGPTSPCALVPACVGGEPLKADGDADRGRVYKRERD
jgi:hypothetical protein